MKALTFISVLTIALVLTGLPGTAVADNCHGGKMLKAQTVCPVMGGDIDKSVYADYEGRRVYFCCAGCIDDFKADPEKYLAVIKENGEKPKMLPKAGKDGETAQITCPHTGKTVTVAKSADGKTYCCAAKCDMAACDKSAEKRADCKKRMKECPRDKSGETAI